MATTTSGERLDERPPMTQTLGLWARYAAVALGLWQFSSARLWNRPYDAQMNTWLVGIAILGFALWAIFTEGLRWFTTALAVWLIISAFAVFHFSGPAFWNDVLVGFLVLALSFVPNAAGAPRQRPA
jgi:hypothetical protein